MDAAEYLRDPCRASALPFWKSEETAIPPHLSVIRDDLLPAVPPEGTDEPYFKLVHDLRRLEPPRLPVPFEPVEAAPEDFVRHIESCYEEERLSLEELRAMRKRPVYDPALWIAVREPESGRIVASGIAELDGRIGEGALEWIQVSPDCRRLGLGRYVVCELLRRMRGKARFVAVSGKLKAPGRPMELYRACGFGDPVIWHVIRRDRRERE